jgi:hypothetical protein
MAMRPAVLACFILLGLLVPCARGDDVWTVTDAQFGSRTIQLDSIDAQGLRAGGDIALSWDSVLDVSRSTAAASGPADRYDAYLSGGDRVGGDPIGVADEKLRWKSPVLGELEFPLDHLLAIARAAAPPPGLDEPRSDDLVRLSNGDQTHGIVSQISAAGVTLQTADATPTLAWDAIGAVLFSTPVSPKADNRRAFRVNFADGSMITATQLSLAGGRLSLGLDEKTSRDADIAAVTSIEQLNGPISWLTDHRPIQNIYRPFFSENFPTRFDRTVDGSQTIPERFARFHHGIGCHSYSRVVYDLDGTYAAFRTQFVVDSDSPLADVTVRILLDDKAVMERKNLKAGRVEGPVVIPLHDAKKLALEVDYGENYSTEGRFAWLDPALLRTMPPAATQPAAGAATQP